MNGTCNVCDEPIMENPSVRHPASRPIASLVHVQYHADEYGAMVTNDDDHEAQSVGEGE